MISKYICIIVLVLAICLCMTHATEEKKMVDWTKEEALDFLRDKIADYDISSLDEKDIQGNDLASFEAEDLQELGVDDPKVSKEILDAIHAHLEGEIESKESINIEQLKHENTDVFSIEKLVEKYGKREVYGNLYLFYSAPQFAFFYHWYKNPILLKSFFKIESFDLSFIGGMILAPHVMIINTAMKHGYTELEPTLGFPLLLAFGLNFLGWIISIVASRGTKLLPISPMDFIGTFVMVFYLIPDFLMEEDYLRYALWASAILTIPKQFVMGYLPYKAQILRQQAQAQKEKKD